MTLETVSSQARPPIWRNVTVLKWVAQIGFLLAFVVLGYIVISTAGDNLRARGILTSTDFFGEPAGISIREGFTTLPETNLIALMVGMVNMLRVTFTGIIAATILGTLVGVARLSSNWIVNKVATGYIETIRNIPLLVQILFWAAVVGAFGQLDENFIGTRILFATSKGIALPWFIPQDGRWQWVAFVIVGLVAARYVFKWRIRLVEAGGHEAYAGTFALGTVVLFMVVGWWAHPVMGFLGFVFSAMASMFGSIPPITLQLLIAVVVFGAAWWWIKRYLDNLRTPAGLAKLTDDDYSRLIFTGLAGLAIGGFFLVRGDVSAMILGQADIFGHGLGLTQIFDAFASKFEWLTTGAPFDFSLPTVPEGQRFIQYSAAHGNIITSSFFAIWVGVTIYTAAFIAEVVRAGILAVPKGQVEAARALGLSRASVLRLVVLPQAFRVVLPPLGNQYLNLAKNTSLGIAVAFSELVAVGETVYNQTGQTVIVFLVWMGFYSIVSLSLSAVVNWQNRRLALVER